MSEELNQTHTELQTVDADVPANHFTENVAHSTVAKNVHVCDPLTGKGHATVRQALACRRRAKAKETEVNRTNIESQTSDAVVESKQSTEPTDNSAVAVAAVSYHICDPLTGKGHATVGQALACRRSSRKRCVPANIDLDELNMHYNLVSLYGTRADSDCQRPKDLCPYGAMDENVENGMDSGDRQAEPPVACRPRGRCACEVCGKVFPYWQRLEKHMNVYHREGLLHCDICGRGFSLLNHLSRHMKASHMKHRPFACDHCGASFAEKGFLDMHMTAHRSESEKEAAAAAAESEQEMHRCRKCSETFTTKSKLHRHMSKTHPARPPRKTKPTQRCICPICGKSLSYRLSVHMRVHTGERPYRCSTCDKSFWQRTSLRDHLTSHTGVKSHTCAQCGKSFRLRALLRQHMRMHTDPSDLRHACPLCSKRFYVPMLLRDHLLLHTGERPHQCSVCGRRFRLRKELVKHERFHSSTDASAVRCDVCGLEVSNLKRHMLVHSGDRPYGCEHCGKAFRRKEHLRAHCSRLHNVELPTRDRVQTVPLDSCLIMEQNQDTSAVYTDDGGLTLVIGDSVVV